MSINLTLVALEPPLAERLVTDFSLTEEIEIEPYRDNRLASLGFHIERTLNENEYPIDRLALGKDWHLVHTLFTRGTVPHWQKVFNSGDVRSFLTTGGKQIGEGSGYGPARLLSAQECGEIDTFLEDFDISLATEELDLDFVLSADVYVYSHGDVPIEEIRQVAMDNFEELGSFFRRVSTAGSSAYIFMS